VSRPKKWRRVTLLPEATYFKPAGVPARLLDEVTLSVEEVEALRLKEVEGLEPERCAREMCVSRPTFHRVLSSARRKLAEAIVKGKALQIQGGTFLPATQTFVCAEDGHQWQVPFQEMVAAASLACPECNSTDVQPLHPLGQRSGGGWGRGWGRRHGRGGGRRSI